MARTDEQAREPHRGKMRYRTAAQDEELDMPHLSRLENGWEAPQNLLRGTLIGSLESAVRCIGSLDSWFMGSWFMGSWFMGSWFMVHGSGCDSQVPASSFQLPASSFQLLDSSFQLLALQRFAAEQCSTVVRRHRAQKQRTNSRWTRLLVFGARWLHVFFGALRLFARLASSSTEQYGTTCWDTLPNTQGPRPDPPSSFKVLFLSPMKRPENVSRTNWVEAEGEARVRNRCYAQAWITPCTIDSIRFLLPANRPIGVRNGPGQHDCASLHWCALIQHRKVYRIIPYQDWVRVPVRARYRRKTILLCDPLASRYAMAAETPLNGSHNSTDSGFHRTPDKVRGYSKAQTLIWLLWAHAAHREELSPGRHSLAPRPPWAVD
eukprot:scaffold94_cov254-Pinguiococcus_pyrenoidosus.AAC.6